MATGIRQQPGLACEECRRKKARCDRTRPQCATCAESGTACVVVDKRPQRGPKKGQLRALRNRVATLERQLHVQSSLVESDAEAGPEAPASAGPDSPLFYGTDASMMVTTGLDMVPPLAPALDDMASLTSIFSNLSALVPTSFPMATDCFMPLSPAVSKTHTPSPTSTAPELDLSELVRANLDQLYFERIHAIAPVVHRRRYFSWAGRDHLTPARECLRSAMQTVAAAVSADFAPLADGLYVQTRRMLDALDASEPQTAAIEHIQAHLLISHYESLCRPDRQIMLTAGRAFRLVQLARLYDVDGVTAPPMTDEGFSKAEEKRRTFWLAFALDRSLSTRNEWPLTLHEDMICTRLPAPETNYQNSQPIQMDFLSEAISTSDGSALSPFAECMVLVALYGRCLTQRRLAHTAAISGANPRTIWSRVEWLAATLEKRRQSLMQATPVVGALFERDLFLTFAHLFVCLAIIHLYYTTQIGSPLSLERHARQAAMYVAQLATWVPRMPFYKVHPHIPLALEGAATFLMTRPDGSLIVEASDEVEQLLGALRSLRSNNLVARDVLFSLEARGWCMAVREDHVGLLPTYP